MASYDTVRTLTLQIASIAVPVHTKLDKTPPRPTLSRRPHRARPRTTMAPPTRLGNPKTRAVRNLAAAVKSRTLKKLKHAELIDRKSHLLEKQALLQGQLAAMPSVVGAPASAPTGRRPAPGMVLLSDDMAAVLGRPEARADALVDLLDRALTGSKGKPPPVDPDLVAEWAQSQRNAPRDERLALRERARLAGAAAAGEKAEGKNAEETAVKGKDGKVGAKKGASSAAESVPSSSRPT